jgi:hypothetical protein
MEISMETLMCLVLGEINGARNEIRKQDKRIARLEQWQERLKTVCAALAGGVCACLCRVIYGR